MTSPTSTSTVAPVQAVGAGAGYVSLSQLIPRALPESVTAAISAPHNAVRPLSISLALCEETRRKELCELESPPTAPDSASAMIGSSMIQKLPFGSFAQRHQPTYAASVLSKAAQSDDDSPVSSPDSRGRQANLVFSRVMTFSGSEASTPSGSPVGAGSQESVAVSSEDAQRKLSSPTDNLDSPEPSPRSGDHSDADSIGSASPANSQTSHTKGTISTPQSAYGSQHQTPRDLDSLAFLLVPPHGPDEASDTSDEISPIIQSPKDSPVGAGAGSQEQVAVPREPVPRKLSSPTDDLESPEPSPRGDFSESDSIGAASPARTPSSQTDSSNPSPLPASDPSHPSLSDGLELAAKEDVIDSGSDDEDSIQPRGPCNTPIEPPTPTLSTLNLELELAFSDQI